MKNKTIKSSSKTALVPKHHTKKEWGSGGKVSRISYLRHKPERYKLQTLSTKETNTRIFKFVFVCVEGVVENIPSLRDTDISFKLLGPKAGYPEDFAV